jgi:hypothetical protein
MNAPKLHHYVPQFYLRRFIDTSGQLWLWERDRDRVFRTRTNGVAAENKFYWQEELAALGHDPLTIEKRFSQLEGEVAQITGQWLEWLRDMKPMEKVEVPDINRELVSLYIALQFLRTAGARDTLVAFAEQNVYRRPPFAILLQFNLIRFSANSSGGIKKSSRALRVVCVPPAKTILSVGFGR